MSKRALIDRIAPQFDSAAAAERALDAITKGIVDQVGDGHMVVLRGFGTFKKKQRAERQGRNPATGEPVKVLAQTKFAFESKITF